MCGQFLIVREKRFLRSVHTNRVHGIRYIGTLLNGSELLSDPAEIEWNPDGSCIWYKADYKQYPEVRYDILREATPEEIQQATENA